MIPKRSRGNSQADEVRFQPSEAERSVTNDLAKEFNVPQMGTGGSGKSAEGLSKKDRGCIPEEWVTIEGKVVSVSTPPSPVIAQSGILADDSGVYGSWHGQSRMRL